MKLLKVIIMYKVYVKTWADLLRHVATFKTRSEVDAFIKTYSSEAYEFVVICDTDI